MKTLTKLLTGTALATTLALNSYSQEMLCDTNYNAEKEITRVVCTKENYGGTRTISVSDFKEGKVYLRTENLRSKTNKRLSTTEYEKGAEGKVLVKVDINGDGVPDQTRIWSDKEKVAFIDGNMDGFFETISTDKEYYSHEKGGLFPEPDETYKITAVAPDTSIKKTKLAGDLENVLLAFVDIYDNENKFAFNIDLDAYNLSYEAKKFDAISLLMGQKEEGLDFNPALRVYIIKRKLTKINGKDEIVEDKKISVIPAIINGGYDFSKDSPKKIEREAKKLLASMGEKEIYVAEPSKMFSAEMFFDLIGKDEKKEKGK